MRLWCDYGYYPPVFSKESELSLATGGLGVMSIHEDDPHLLGLGHNGHDGEEDEEE